MTTLEEMIEAARNLPPEDRQRLQQWLQEQEQHDAQQQQHSEKLCREMEQYQQARQWIAEHRAEYLGQWVVLEGDQLISHGTDGSQVYDQAKAAGIKAPFLVQIVEEPAAFFTGLL
ncbi:MAG: DUF5678 domain-containing protein [Blastocatellia bacterium]